MTEAIPLGARSKQVLEVLQQTSEGMTMGEVFGYLRDSGADMLGFNENLTSRANDLERLGLIRRAAKRTCGLSGKAATVWHAVPVDKIGENVTRPRRSVSDRFIEFFNGVADAVQAGSTDPALEEKLRTLIQKASES